MTTSVSAVNSLSRQECLEAARRLREFGYAVTVMSPEELGSQSARHVEEIMVEHANDMIGPQS